MGNRKTVTEVVNYYSPYDFDGTLQDVLETVQDLIDAFGPKARLDYDPHHCEQYSTSPSPRFGILVSRQETEEEYLNRVAIEKAQGVDSEARERAEFERLSKKFGKSGRFLNN